MRTMQFVKENVWYIVLFVVVAGGVALFDMRGAPNTEFSRLSWGPYERNTVEPTGFLVELRNASSGAAVYISSDKLADETQYVVQPGWEVETLDEQTIWNPRVCARVPSVITAEGDIFMVEEYRERGKYMSQLVWFDKSDGELRATDGNIFNVPANALFLNTEGHPMFFGVTNGQLYHHVFITPDATLVSRPLRPIAQYENVIVRTADTGEPVIEVFDEETATTERSIFTADMLTPYSGLYAESDTAFLDETTIVQQLDEDLRAISTLETVYDVQIESLNSGEVLQYKPEERVYTFVVGSY